MEQLVSLKELVKQLKLSGIHSDRIKTIKIHWEKLFDDRAFPIIEIELFKEK